MAKQLDEYEEEITDLKKEKAHRDKDIGKLNEQNY